LTFVIIAGCNAPSSMDHFKEAEAKRESRLRESAELKRLKSENQRLKSLAIRSQESHRSVPDRTTVPQAPLRSSPNIVGGLEYDRPYSDSEIKAMAARMALVHAAHEGRTITSNIGTPGYEVTEKVWGTKNSDRTIIGYNPNKRTQSTQPDGGRCSENNVTLNLNKEDGLLWARAEVSFGGPAAPGKENRLFYYFKQMRRDDGTFLWKPYNTKGMTK
jgi:hypothetical protein